MNKSAIQPIQFKRKIRTPLMVSTINRLSVKWDMTQHDVIFKLLNECVRKEAEKLEKE